MAVAIPGQGSRDGRSVTSNGLRSNTETHGLVDGHLVEAIFRLIIPSDPQLEN